MVQTFSEYLEYRHSYYSNDFTTTESPNLQFNMDETFFKVMHYRVRVSTFLIIQSIIMNTLLLIFLFSHKESRSWMFFPLMMQATVDIIGPGIANMIYEWKLYFHWPVAYEYFTTSTDYKEPLIDNEDTLQALPGPFACVLMHFRSLLNEYSTGYCLLATAFFRYILVCHPNFKLTPKFCKFMAVGLVSVPCIGMFGSFLDLMFNDYGYKYIDTFYVYGDYQFST